MKRLLIVILAMLLTNAGCRKGKPDSESDLVNAPHNIFRGVPTDLAGTWSGPCQASESCTSELYVQLEQEKIAIRFFYVIDEKVYGLTAGPYDLENNNILDNDGYSVGAIGHGGFFLARPDIGKLTATKQENGTLVLIIEQGNRERFKVEFPPLKESRPQNIDSSLAAFLRSALF